MSTADRRQAPRARPSRAGSATPAAAATPDAVPVFAALGDATRLQLVVRLSDGQARSITQLTAGLGQTRQGVTKHLRVLEEAGLVSSIRIGRESQYAFVPEPLARARSYLEAVSMQWDDALGRLQSLVEADDQRGDVARGDRRRPRGRKAR